MQWQRFNNKNKQMTNIEQTNNTKANILFENNEIQIVEATTLCQARTAAEICAKEFHSCPFFYGLEMSEDDRYTIFYEAAKISLAEKLLIVAIDKQTNQITTASVGLNQKGRDEYAKVLPTLKVNFDIDMYYDLNATVELDEKEDAVYLYLYATTGCYRNKGIGSSIVKSVLKDIKNKGYNSAYGEVTNSKSEYIVKKLGAITHKTMKYTEYEFRGKKLKIIDENERQTAFEYILSNY